MEQCADSEISRIMDSFDQLHGEKSGSNLDSSKPSPFDDKRWNEFVIAHCQAEIRQDTGVSLYQEYGTMERMLYKMCVLDQTKVRLEGVTGHLANQPSAPQN